MQSSSLANRDLKINWWLWATLSGPPMAYLLSHRWLDKAGDVHSNWSVLWDDGFRYTWEIWVPNILFPLVLGWLAQYLLVLAWNYRKHKG
jgi:hypothetical protein